MALPYRLLAELTCRCPLHCPYCSNLRQAEAGGSAELDTQEWIFVFRQARELGVLQLLLSGGEPLLRPDLATLIRQGREFGFYTNLITSGIGLHEIRMGELRQAGLDGIQISLQADEATLADAIAGSEAHEKKLEAAKLAKASGCALTLNIVLHR